jgi:PAS domain S-box-containing protein
MTISTSVQRYGSALAICCAGIALSWVSGEPSSLLAAIATVCVYGGRRLGLVSIVVCSLAFGLVLLLPEPDIPAEAKFYLRIVVFLASALVVGLLIQGYQRETSSHRAEYEGRLIAENKPGHGASMDINGQKKAEDALRASEQQLRLLVDTIPTLVWCATAQGEPSYFNKRLMDYVGLTLEDLDTPGGSRLATAIHAVVHPDDSATLQRVLVHSFTTGEPFILQYRMRRADGVYRWVDGRAEALRDVGGRIVQWYGVCVDIDDERRMQEALRAAHLEHEARLIVENMPGLGWSTDPDGNFKYVNQSVMDYVGKPPEDLSRIEGSDTFGWEQVVHPDDVELAVKKWLHSLRTGDTYEIEHRIRRRDGVFRWFRNVGRPSRDRDGKVTGWYGTAIDIDDRKNAQEALWSVQDKLSRAAQAASLAEMSASIAHEVNQPLAAVVNHSHACQGWLAADPPNIERARDTIDRIIRDAHSAAEVLRRIRALFKQTTSTKALVDINEVIAEVCQFMSDDATMRKITIETNLNANLPPIIADRVQMQQVLVNLFRNGIEAMQSTAEVPKFLSVRSRLDGQAGVLVEVRDRGGGIEEPEKLFEPFFTTKENGMGMGLAICRTIIEAHDGQLWVAKSDPKGTVFSFTLPGQPRDRA